MINLWEECKQRNSGLGESGEGGGMGRMACFLGNVEKLCCVESHFLHREIISVVFCSQQQRRT